MKKRHTKIVLSALWLTAIFCPVDERLAHPGILRFVSPSASWLKLRLHNWSPN
jgi:hypothetical protein